jgi:hypothetical protein
MARGRIYRDVKIYSGGYDISGASNTLKLGYEFDEVEFVGFGDQCRHSKPGLPKLSIDLSGHADSDGAGQSEDVLTSQLQTLAVPVIWCPLTGAAGEVGYFAESLALKYSAGGQIGEAYDFEAHGVGKNRKLVRGMMLENGAKVATGVGTARQLGAVAAIQYIYGCLQVLDVDGTNPTLDLVVQSDDAQGFASPVTRLTFTQRTAIGSQFVVPVVGPVTDTWWRASWTIGGTADPSFTIALAVGIL